MRRERQFKPNRFQLMMHHLYDLALIIFFTIHTTALAAVIIEPMIRRELMGSYDEFIVIYYLVLMSIITGILSYRENTKIFEYYQDKRKRESHEFL